ncbi:MAG: hypothetical protein AABO41_06460 [Acidobacteriota bacterium]
MSITMQGPWTVSVKAKNAAFPQRFIISGAATGNGTYVGDPTTPAVSVTGDSWAITIQNNPGTGFQDSDEQIKFPFISGGQYHFDIESNDAGGDADFNDLVLRCRTPVTLSDFLIYGNVSYYDERCMFNPCFPRWVVIDNLDSLLEAVKNPHLRKPIEKLYPDRLRVPPRRPIPIPPDPPFRPLVIPLEEDAAIPPKRAQILKAGPPADVNLANATARASESKAKAVTSAEPVDATVRGSVASRTFSLASSSASKVVEIDRGAVANIFDRVKLFCDSGPLPGVALRFQEYDRTSSEKTGGPYTGDGDRDALGVCATDRHGNYIFRFRRSLFDYFDEFFGDVAIGENEFVQIMPDVIVQLLDSSAPGGVAFESAPYWNIPLFKRINICIPRGKIGHLPTSCQGHNAIQAIGNIFIGDPPDPAIPGQPPGFGERVGFNNFLGATGRITSKSAILGTPHGQCAAWHGYLDLFACFLDQADVTQYTIRFRKHGTSAWHFFSETYLHPMIAHLALPNYSGDPVGPHDSPLHVDGAALAEIAPAYYNIETDNAWIFTHRDRKAVISSWVYAPTPGPVDFRIEGYNAAGNKVDGADDMVTLFIDNDAPDFEIRDVTMAGIPGSDCALFKLPPGDPRAPLTVTFKANEKFGFMNSYRLSVKKGNTADFTSIDGAAPPPPPVGPVVLGTPTATTQGAYTHGGDLVCNQFFGTLEAIGSFDFATVNITPPNGGNWLTPTQTFCTFIVSLGCSKRVTNGYTDAVAGFGPAQYLFGIEV